MQTQFIYSHVITKKRSEMPTDLPLGCFFFMQLCRSMISIHAHPAAQLAALESGDSGRDGTSRRCSAPRRAGSSETPTTNTLRPKRRSLQILPFTGNTLLDFSSAGGRIFLSGSVFGCITEARAVDHPKRDTRSKL